MTRHLLVRADGDSQIGLGHVLRSMAVADELTRTGVRITYFCRSLSHWAETQLKVRGFGVERSALSERASQTEDADMSFKVVKRTGADAILLDHYGLTEEWTKRIKQRSDTFIAAFDDLASDRRAVDLLIDASPGRKASDYKRLIPSDADCLTGPTYAPLRPEFALAREAARAGRQGPRHVAISMGGVDPAGVTLTCLDALDHLLDVDLTVILSSDAAKLEATKARVAMMTTPTRLLLDRTDMPTVLKDIDLVIGAGGTSALERCALGLPTVLAVLADNQMFNAVQLAEAGAVVVLPKLSVEAIREAVQPLLENAERRAEMGRKAARLCDGLGATRVAAGILARTKNVTLRDATMGDMQMILDWQSEPDARQYSRNPNAPTLDEHEAWFGSRLARMDQDPFHIILHDGQPAGFVRLDRTSEVSILVPQAAQGRGLARTALGLLRLTHPRRHIVAEVHPENTASQRLFEKAGYSRIAANRFASAGWAEIVERQQDED